MPAARSYFVRLQACVHPNPVLDYPGTRPFAKSGCTTVTKVMPCDGFYFLTAPRFAKVQVR